MLHRAYSYDMGCGNVDYHLSTVIPILCLGANIGDLCLLHPPGWRVSHSTGICCGKRLCYGNESSSCSSLRVLDSLQMLHKIWASRDAEVADLAGLESCDAEKPSKSFLELYILCLYTCSDQDFE